ncbi:MAG: hypothetical protein OQK04_04345 [Kangiellaceae bacterium]|nr:hypothetical protein [Kangiellaceae bacterium]MCW8997925.1 hypothetical protein [Kangiellaceae bacterium]
MSNERSEVMLRSVYEGYLEERKNHFAKRWSTFTSFYKRIFDHDSEYIYLLNREKQFQEKVYDWVSGHISTNELELEDIKSCRMSIKFFVEELRGRNIFLIIFITLVTVSFTLSNLLSSSLTGLPNASLALANGFVAVLVLVERGNIGKHVGYCNQLDALFERWIDETTEMKT